MTRFSRFVASALALLASACEGSPFTTDDGGNADASTAGSNDGPTIILVRTDGTAGAPSDGGDASLCAAPTSLDCNGTCVDPTLPAHCGSCGHACPGADGGHATCMAGGVCGVACDPSSATPTNCNGACVNLQTDPLHCGGCLVTCAAPGSTHGNPACLAPGDGGATCGVVCEAGYHACHGDCLPNVDAPSATSDPCVLSESFGVFASPSPMGSDTTGNGSRAQPFATIAHAMEIAVTGTTRVYACGSAGSYFENLMVGASRGGVTVYGAIDCTTAPGTWTYNAAKPATVAPSAGYALRVAALTKGTAFEDFVFHAADAATAGGSSIAVFVASATGAVAFRRVAMVAGTGMAGASGANGGTTASSSNWFGGSLNGRDATAAAPGGPAKCACGDKTMGIGGQGGSPTLTPAAGLPAYGRGSAGTNQRECGSGGSPVDNGGDAPSGAADAPVIGHGTLAVGGFTLASSAQGSNGKVGQGGGGGGDGPFNSDFGGGGACGGCGGAGGKAGGGGGSSIALLSYQSAVTLLACTLTAGSAGGGGSGGAGEGGQAGGPGGAPSRFGCQAGNGGNGAGGNGGQGGAGGFSLAIGYSGAVPAIDPGTTMTVGSLGVGGPGGPGGAAAPGSANPGAPGAKGSNGITQSAPLPL